MHIFWAVIVGIVIGVAIGLVTGNGIKNTVIADLNEMKRRAIAAENALKGK